MGKMELPDLQGLKVKMAKTGRMENMDKTAKTDKMELQDRQVLAILTVVCNETNLRIC